MRVGLVGFGKTGKAVASVLLESGAVELTWVLRRSHILEHRSASEWLGISSSDPGTILCMDEQPACNLLDDLPVDVIVDFSADGGIAYYGPAAANRDITIVSAVSQYSNESQELIRHLASLTRVMHSPNITLGINFLIIAAKVLRSIAPNADIEIIEEHFKKKPEVSGTARTIAHHLNVSSDDIKIVRAGGIIGRHEVLFGFPYQTVRLTHESISREAFGNGILFALENLPQEGCGQYTMEDLLLPYFNLHGTTQKQKSAIQLC